MTCSTNLTVICDTKGFATRPEEIKILQISVKYETGKDQVLATVVKGNKPRKSNNLPLLVNGSFERGKESEAWLEAIYHNAPYGELSCVVKVEGDPRDENYQKFTTTAIFNSKTQPEIKKKGLALHVTQDCGTGSKSAAYKPIISPLVMIVVVILSLVSVSGSFF
ncbi:hypothetical protein BaRGS_00033483 [Batillaria attramentaria]|uniref:Uncharacterized protein n=1 Tax=Batillaria attramentaria TaxID=370345 RepID=A0ABD0JJR9_9CAEN